MLAKEIERAIHVEGAAFGQYALGLFDDQSRVQRGLQLVVDHLRPVQDPLVEDADGRYVGECLSHGHVREGHRTGLAAETG